MYDKKLLKAQIDIYLGFRVTLAKLKKNVKKRKYV